MAFEDFKSERGSEINRIFKENKSILNERRKRASETTQRINAIKREMDVTKEGLSAQKSLREKQGEEAGGGWAMGPLSRCSELYGLGTSRRTGRAGAPGTFHSGSTVGAPQPWGARVLPVSQPLPVAPPGYVSHQR